MERNNENGAHVDKTTANEFNTSASKNGEAKMGQVTPPAQSEKVKPGAGNGAKPNSTKPTLSKDEVPETEHASEQVKPVQPALNLQVTLKVVEDLHRRSIQRLNLITRIRQLEAFEVVLTQEHDELEDNPYQGCKLIIEDDKQRRFITTTPGLIRLVSQFIFDACNGKLAEIEASIVFPNP